MAKDFICKEIPLSTFEDRCFHTSTLYKNYLITYGGYSINSSKCLNDIKVLDMRSLSYESFKLEGDQPVYRNRHSACLFDSNKILIFGGFHTNILHDTAIITIKEASTLTLTYKKIKTIGGDDFGRSYHSADIYKNKMYVFGGRQAGKLMEITNELWNLDLESFQWEICKTTGSQPEPRAAHCSTVYHNKLYIFGGFSDSRMFPLESWCVLSFETMNWEVLEIQNFQPIYSASSFMIKDEIFITGGYYGSENSSKTSIQIYNLRENTLSCSKIQGDYIPVKGGTVATYENNILLCGGLKSDKEAFSSLLRLQFNTYTGENFGFSHYTASLFNSEQYANIHFLIEGEQIPAHKLILILRCKYFSNLFTSGMKESYSSVIEIIDIKLKTFKAFLRFLYQKKVRFTEELTLDLYEVADKYTQSELAQLCEKFLVKNLRFDNLMTMVNFAEKFEVDFLKEGIVKFLMQNFQEIKQNQDKYTLPPFYIWEVASRFQEKIQIKDNLLSPNFMLNKTKI